MMNSSQWRSVIGVGILLVLVGCGNEPDATAIDPAEGPPIPAEARSSEGAPPEVAERYTLAITQPPPEGFPLQVHAAMKMVTETADDEVIMVGEQKLEFVFRPAPEAEGDAAPSVQGELQRLVVSAYAIPPNPAASLDFDSAREDVELSAVDQVFQMLVGETLIVEPAEGPGAYQLNREPLVAALREKTGSDDAQALANVAESLTTWVDGLFAAYPSHPVAVGEQWSADYRMATDPEQAGLCRAVFTLANVDDETATIRFEAESTRITTGARLGTLQGVVQLERDTGWPREAEITTEFRGGTAARHWSSEPVIRFTSLRQ